MTRRLLGPVGGPIVFVLIAALVFAGLGWLTVVSLRVETAQREAAARAEHEGNLRVALWRLDGRVLPVLGVEDSRPFHHYAGADLATVYGPGTAPLLEPDLPGWMRLHFQVDPHGGWSSPQVVDPNEARRLRDVWPGLTLRNATPDRAKLLAELSARHPARELTDTLAARERTFPVGHGPLVNWNTVAPLPPELRIPDAAPAAEPPSGVPQAPGATAPPNPTPAAAALGRDVNPEYKAQQERFERKALQAGAQRDFALQVPAPPPPAGTAPAAGLAAVNPMPTGRVEANTMNESQVRNNVLLRGFADARSASQYPPTQQMQVTPGGNSQTGVASNGGLGGLGGGGGFGFRGSQPGSGPVAQTTPVAPPSILPGPSGPGGPAAPAAPAAGPAVDKPGVALAMKPAGAAGGGPGGFGSGAGGRPQQYADYEGFFFSRRYRSAGDDNVALGKAGVTKKIDDGGPTAASPLAAPGGPAAGGRPASPQLAERSPAGGPFPELGATLRDRETELRRSRAAGTPAPAVLPPAEPAPTPGPPPTFHDGAALDATRAALPVVHLGSIHPQWLTTPGGADVLVLVRAAHIDNTVVYQGVVLDWPQLEAELLASVRDLFPEARLVPVRDPAAASPERAMTALPVQLDPGPPPAPPPAGWSPLRLGLVLAWVAAVIALSAVGLSGWTLIDLAERRIRFVGAVTHELRTPLTSLRLYLDLLLSGMVADEAKRREYLATLNTESDRLHRLIDNVLDFARLEGRRKTSDAGPVRVCELVEQVRQTWADRCAADDKELVSVCTLPPDAKLTTDVSLVQQVVGNLIDNARKYSRDAADRRIWVWAKPGTGRRNVVIEVEDRGAGVPPRERKHIFRPFRRGDTADARAGGAGLGLALAKQWAELLGGRLTYRPADGGVGACFRLELRGTSMV